MSAGGRRGVVLVALVALGFSGLIYWWNSRRCLERTLRFAERAELETYTDNPVLLGDLTAARGVRFDDPSIILYGTDYQCLRLQVKEVAATTAVRVGAAPLVVRFGRQLEVVDEYQCSLGEVELPDLWALSPRARHLAWIWDDGGGASGRNGPMLHVAPLPYDSATEPVRKFPRLSHLPSATRPKTLDFVDEETLMLGFASDEALLWNWQRSREEGRFRLTPGFDLLRFNDCTEAAECRVASVDLDSGRVMISKSGGGAPASEQVLPLNIGRPLTQGAAGAGSSSRAPAIVDLLQGAGGTAMAFSPGGVAAVTSDQGVFRLVQRRGDDLDVLPGARRLPGGQRRIDQAVWLGEETLALVAEPGDLYLVLLDPGEGRGTATAPFRVDPESGAAGVVWVASHGEQVVYGTPSGVVLGRLETLCRHAAPESTATYIALWLALVSLYTTLSRQWRQARQRSGS